MSDLVTIESSALPTETHVVSVRGKETLSLPFRFEVGLRIDDDQIDLDAAIRERATITFNRGGDADHVVHGLISYVENLLQWEGRTLCRVVIVPKVWNLGQSRHSRVFTDNTIPEIIEAVLEFGGLGSDEFELRLQGDYGAHEHVFQYQESNLAFISRWMERLGMYYFFEHVDGVDKLIITDDKATHELSREEPVRYVPGSDDDFMADEAFDGFHCAKRALPASISLIDYDYTNPSLAVTGEATVVGDGIGEVHRHDHNFRSPGDGNRHARVRAEELLATERVFHGRGRVFGLRSGYTYTLDEHPRAEFNTDYLVTEIEYYVNQIGNDATTKRLLGLSADDDRFGTDELGVLSKAIRADIQYRAPERHPWPRIDGYEMATVCGDADSPYAQIDDHGRYRLRIHCDESDLVDGSATTWVRMLQPHGGGNEGFHFPLRKATEVILIFLGGDPDQPVLAGVVPNAHTPSPVTSANNTLNVIQSGGLNRLEMKDDEGTQHFKLSSPPENTHIHLGAPNDDHNLHICTDGDTITYSGRNWDCFTYGEKYEYVQLDSDTNIDGNEFITVVGMRCENVQQHVTENYDMDHVVTVLGMQDILVSGDRVDHVESNVTENYDTNHELNVGSNQIMTVGGTTGYTHEGETTITINNKLTETIAQDTKREVTGGNYDLTVSGDYNIKAANHDEFYAGPEIKFKAATSSETTIGIKNENLIGGKIESLLGLKAEATMSVRFALASGAVAEADASVKMETIASKMETIAADMQTIATILTTGSIDLDLTGMKIM